MGKHPLAEGSQTTVVRIPIKQAKKDGQFRELEYGTEGGNRTWLRY